MQFYAGLSQKATKIAQNCSAVLCSSVLNIMQLMWLMVFAEQKNRAKTAHVYKAKAIVAVVLSL